MEETLSSYRNEVDRNEDNKSSVGSEGRPPASSFSPHPSAAGSDDSIDLGLALSLQTTEDQFAADLQKGIAEKSRTYLIPKYCKVPDF